MQFDIAETLKQEKEARKAYLASEVIEESCIPIINQMSKGKQAWDMIILVLAVITSFTVGFELVLSSLRNNLEYKFFSIFSDLCFLADICVAFRTTYFSVEGEEVRDWKKISARYMSGMFIIDLIATIPWSYFGEDILTLLKILKVSRITRFTKVIEKLELKED